MNAVSWKTKQKACLYADTKMTIRLATYHDISEMLNTFAHARQQMIQDGNPTQWGDGYPQQEQLESDIKQCVSYVVVDEHSQEIFGTFAFIIGEDPTYLRIDDGQWLNNEPYGTIHRIASNGKQTGIFRTALQWCYKQCPNIRIDTHHDNQRMIHLIEQAGFQQCGIIYTRNGSPRIAYQATK